ncbi:hypothetical protein DW355_06350 [Hylemonella gracilis]|uniref:Lipoprotein n=1 Tax=Hylemonella gracilis TaxID=80880 RepID=A0A4P6UGT1_9BURK|nr:hypothetical protein [Hylemonella gracilis]QBK04458.1 hypothetical protein DW355_06350 [Hylemonella gracilis]
MKKIFTAIAVIGLALILQGCSTRTYVMVPENTKLVLPAKGDTSYVSGQVATRPFSWGQSGGITYQLKKNDTEVVSSGKLKSSFRIASIFWPPVAIAYWPIGFGWHCYDLRGQEPTQCSPSDLNGLRTANRKEE